MPYSIEARKAPVSSLLTGSRCQSIRTTGSSLVANAQPFRIYYSGTSFAIAHNGNLVNARQIRSELEGTGSIFQTGMDTEVVLHLTAKFFKKGMEQAMIETMAQIKGAYSLIIMTEDTIIAARDPNGFRPLCLGRLDSGYVLASETCAFDLVEAEYIRDIAPGEILIINQNGLKSIPSGIESRISQTAMYLARTFICFAKSRGNSWPGSFP
jgi:amidophosphoribosyltransferase